MRSSPGHKDLRESRAVPVWIIVVALLSGCVAAALLRQNVGNDVRQDRHLDRRSRSAVSYPGGQRASTTWDNNDEFVGFAAPSSGTVTISVSKARFDASSEYCGLGWLHY